jgi:tetratricopeptide (TPR) repeat protein
MKHWAALLVAMTLAACAASPALQSPQSLFDDALFAPASERISADDVFAVSPDMKRYVGTEIAAELADKGRQQGLFDALYGKGQLRLEYESEMTRTAAQAFAARSGNCLSLVIMTAAFAKALDLTVTFQQVYIDESLGRSGDLYLSIGHVNVTLGNRYAYIGSSRYEGDRMTIDFLPPAEIRGVRTRVIGEKTIVAMYMNNRAVEALAQGRLDDAYWWVREAIGQDPKFVSAWNTLGVVYQRHGNPAEAERTLTYALARDPWSAPVLSNLVSALKALGRDAEAGEIARTLARLEPDPPFAFFNRGVAAMRKGDYRTAKEMFAKEVGRAPYYHEFHFWLGAAHLALGEYGLARTHLTIALEYSSKPADRELYAAKLERIKAARGP